MLRGHELERRGESERKHDVSERNTYYRLGSAHSVCVGVAAGSHRRRRRGQKNPGRSIGTTTVATDYCNFSRVGTSNAIAAVGVTSLNTLLTSSLLVANSTKAVAGHASLACLHEAGLSPPRGYGNATRRRIRRE